MGGSSKVGLGSDLVLLLLYYIRVCELSNKRASGPPRPKDEVERMGCADDNPLTPATTKRSNKRKSLTPGPVIGAQVCRYFITEAQKDEDLAGGGGSSFVMFPALGLSYSICNTQMPTIIIIFLYLLVTWYR